jgi:hypothetical protein
MNKRIQELAEQAELNLELQSLRVEKFAKLIVRECANVELYWLSMADRTGVVEKIYQHFGVEE